MQRLLRPIQRQHYTNHKLLLLLLIKQLSINPDEDIILPWKFWNVIYFILLALLSTLHYSTLLCSTVLYSTLLYTTLIYSALLYPTLLYSTLLYSTLLYDTLLWSSWNQVRQWCQTLQPRSWSFQRPSRTNCCSRSSGHQASRRTCQLYEVVWTVYALLLMFV